MSSSRIRGIFFDLGNVLVSLDSDAFARKMISLTGLNLEQLRSFFAGKSVLDYECGRVNDDEFLLGLCNRAGVEITRKDFTDAWTCMFRDTTLISEDLLKELARKYQLWAISNTNKMHFEFIREHYRFLEHFRGWSLSYQVGAAKPDPAIFRHALANSAIAASEALLIDDQVINVESARSLGFDAIQFIDAGLLSEELRTRKIITNCSKT
jgi:putative hydrolase of the HAD superfamily